MRKGQEQEKTHTTKSFYVYNFAKIAQLLNPGKHPDPNQREKEEEEKI